MSGRARPPESLLVSRPGLHHKSFLTFTPGFQSVVQVPTGGMGHKVTGTRGELLKQNMFIYLNMYHGKIAYQISGLYYCYRKGWIPILRAS